jgi:hypothetical protein
METVSPVKSGMNDFDFFVGRWHVHHRRLKARLADGREWQTFDGRTTVRKILGGQGNLDDNVIELPDGAYRAATLRSYDPKTQKWSIWWLDARNPHALDAPTIGSFENGVGTFFADDTFNGKPVKARFVWSHIAPRSARWEQAFSPDGGENWEINWTMEFARTE